MLEIVNHILVFIASMSSITYIKPEVTFVTNYKYQNVNFMPNNMGTTYLLIQRNLYYYLILEMALNIVN